MTTDEHAEQLVPLSVLALELPESADELATQLAGSIIIADELGRRCVEASVARELIEQEARRRHEAAERKRRRLVAMAERHRALAKKHAPVSRGVQLDVPEGMTPALAMVSQDGPAIYEGGTYSRRPSAGEWHFDDVEGGSAIGPTPSEMRRTAKERAGERKSKKGRAT